MWADEDLVELNALGSERVQDEALGQIEVSLRKARGSESVLIADHDEPISRLRQSQQ